MRLLRVHLEPDPRARPPGLADRDRPGSWVICAPLRTVEQGPSPVDFDAVQDHGEDGVRYLQQRLAQRTGRRGQAHTHAPDPRRVPAPAPRWPGPDRHLAVPARPGVAAALLRRGRLGGYGVPPSEYTALYEQRDRMEPLPFSQYWIGSYAGNRGASI